MKPKNKYKNFSIIKVRKNIEKKIVSKNVVDFIMNYKRKEDENITWLYHWCIIEDIKCSFNEQEIKKLLEKYPELLGVIN